MKRILLAATAAAIVAAPLAAAPVFVFSNANTGGAEEGTQARAGFVTAGNIWSMLFKDNVTIRVSVGFSQLAPNVLAQAGSALSTRSYAATRTALALDASSQADEWAVASLEAGPTFSFMSNEPGNCQTGVGCAAIDETHRSLDNDNTFDNLNLRLNTSVEKALGLRIDNGALDVAITFSNQFTYDFDPSDGITAGQFDFIGLALHEIGHGLGFRSGVDTVDANARPNPVPQCQPNGCAGLDNIAYATALDLFRYDANGVRSLTVDSFACLSLVGGACFEQTSFSTGARNGDGRQASHFKDNLGLGIMDPTAARGERLTITNYDLLAFDIMGWDLVNPVPEPGALALLGFGLLGFAGMRRRRKA